MRKARALCFVIAGVIFSSETLAVSAVDGQGKLERLGMSGATAPGITVSTELRNKRRCVEVCGDGTACKQSICYESTSEKCHFSVIGAANLVPTPAATERNESCTYDKSGVQECVSTYQSQARNYFHHLFPFPPFDGETFLDFAVQTPQDAIISLSINGTHSGIKYELVLGKDLNKYTDIRRRWNEQSVRSLLADGDGVVSEHEMRRFWLRYDHGTFALGKHQQRAYLEWTDPTPPAQPVRFIGLGGWVDVVDWNIYDICPVGPLMAGRATCCIPVDCNDKK